MPLPVRNLGQLLILAGLCAFLTAILGAVVIIDALKAEAVQIPSTLAAFAGVAYTALFGQGVYTMSTTAQVASRAADAVTMQEAVKSANGMAAAAAAGLAQQGQAMASPAPVAH